MRFSGKMREERSFQVLYKSPPFSSPPHRPLLYFAAFITLIFISTFQREISVRGRAIKCAVNIHKGPEIQRVGTENSRISCTCLSPHNNMDSLPLAFLRSGNIRFNPHLLTLSFCPKCKIFFFFSHLQFESLSSSD